uniref:G-protein coupled receptors family 1 profile domain-containing protein n=1 Tax=Glossina brevipalpis TaxID=37001 RepID=A0A1A9W481_9MUSC
MHLCTISVDRYLSLRYPMRFGRNKTRRRVTLKIVFVWLLSIAMSLPLSLMYSKSMALQERRCTWRRFLKTGQSATSSVLHAHSANSTDTELSTLDNHELWLPESSVPEPTPTTMTALHQFGAEMLKLSRGLESVATSSTESPTKSELSTTPNHSNYATTHSQNSPHTTRRQQQQQQHQQQQQQHIREQNRTSHNLNNEQQRHKQK